MAPFRERSFREIAHVLLYIFGGIAGALVAVVLLYSVLFGPPGNSREYEEFIVTPDMPMLDVANALKEAGYVKQGWTFYIAYAVVRGEETVRPGGYELSKSMDAWQVAETLGRAPYLAWVSIPTGVRKEQVAGILANALSWTRDETDAWLQATEASTTAALTEGVFYADTYLIPSDQDPSQIAQRLRHRFDEETADLYAQAVAKDLEWSEVITLASLIEKEAGKRDKALVSGILWNRIEKGMLLQVDATLQYATGSEEEGWWTAPRSEDKYVESPYNTYEHEGLPPTPIATPSLASIEAALNPDKTKCLYYLHDDYGRIHCTTNYQAHLSNINRYLR